MANYDVQEINIQFNADTGNAVGKINELAEALKKIKGDGGATGNALEGMATAVSTLNQAFAASGADAWFNGLKNSMMFAKAYADTFAQIKDRITGASYALTEFGSNAAQAKGIIDNLSGSKNLVTVGFTTDGLEVVEGNFNRLRDVTSEARSGVEEVSRSISDVPNLDFGRGSSEAQSIVSILEELKGVAQETTEVLKKMNGEASNVTKDLKKTADSSKALGNSMKSLNNSTKEASKGLKKLAESFGRVLKYRILRGIITGISKAAKEGLANVAQYSKAIGEIDANNANGTLSQFSTITMQIKNSLGSALIPVLRTLMPVIQAVADVFMNAVNMVNKFFSILNGAKSWTKAKSNYVDYADSVAKSSGGAAKAAKELQRTILAFDEINKLNDDKASGSGGGSGSGSNANYEDMFEEVALNQSDFSKLRPILEFAESLKGVFDKIFTILNDIWNSDLIRTIISESFEGPLDTLAVGLTGVENVLEGIDDIIHGRVGSGAKKIGRASLGVPTGTAATIGGSIFDFGAGALGLEEDQSGYQSYVGKQLINGDYSDTKSYKDWYEEKYGKTPTSEQPILNPYDGSVQYTSAWDAMYQTQKGLYGNDVARGVADFFQLWTTTDLEVPDPSTATRDMAIQNYLDNLDKTTLDDDAKKAIKEYYGQLGYEAGTPNNSPTLWKRIQPWLDENLSEPSTATRDMAIQNYLDNLDSYGFDEETKKAIRDYYGQLGYETGGSSPTLWQRVQTWWDDSAKDKVLECCVSIGNKLGDAWTQLKAWWDTTKGKVVDYFVGIGNKLGDAWEQLKLWWNNTTGKVAEFFVSIGNKIGEAWTQLTTWWNESVKGKATTFFAQIGNKLGDAWQQLSTWWAETKDKAVGFKAKLNETAGTLWAKVTNVWSQVKSELKVKFGLFSNSLSNIWEAIKSFFSFKKINLQVSWSAATSGFQSVISNALFGSIGRKGQWPKLSFAAHGGVFNTGSMIWAGEAGPELVANAGGGRTGIMNIDQMQMAITAGMSNATADQNRLLREQNQLLRALLDKDLSISTSSIVNGLNRTNKRTGKTVVAVGV